MIRLIRELLKEFTSGTYSETEKIKSRAKNIQDWDDVTTLLKDYFGNTVVISHATDKAGAESIQANGLIPVGIKNRKSYGSNNGFYVQAFKNQPNPGDTYANGLDRPYLFTAEISTEMLSYFDADTDGAVDDNTAIQSLEIDPETWNDIDSDTRSFLSTLVSYNYKLDGFEFLVREDMLPQGFNGIKMNLVSTNEGTLKEFKTGTYGDYVGKRTSNDSTIHGIEQTNDIEIEDLGKADEGRLAKWKQINRKPNTEYYSNPNHLTAHIRHLKSLYGSRISFYSYSNGRYIFYDLDGKIGYLSPNSPESEYK